MCQGCEREWLQKTGLTLDDLKAFPPDENVDFRTYFPTNFGLARLGDSQTAICSYSQTAKGDWIPKAKGYDPSEITESVEINFLSLNFDRLKDFLNLPFLLRFKPTFTNFCNWLNQEDTGKYNSLLIDDMLNDSTIGLTFFLRAGILAEGESMNGQKTQRMLRTNLYRLSVHSGMIYKHRHPSYDFALHNPYVWQTVGQLQ